MVEMPIMSVWRRNPHRRLGVFVLDGRRIENGWHLNPTSGTSLSGADTGFSEHGRIPPTHLSSLSVAYGKFPE